MQNSIGILKVVNRLELSKDDEVLDLIMEAAESFNIGGIKRCTLLNENLREFLLKHASRPQPLLHQSRVYVRKLLTMLAIESQKNLLSKQKSRQQSTTTSTPSSSSPPLYKPRPRRAAARSMTPNASAAAAAARLTPMSSVDSDIELEEELIEPTENEDLSMSEDYDSELDEATIDRLNQMTLDEIEDEFATGGNADPEKLKLLTALLRRTSSKPSENLMPNIEVLERIEELPLPDVIKSYLNYEITFPSFDDIMSPPK